jgi:hypothetical protein
MMVKEYELDPSWMLTPRKYQDGQHPTDQAINKRVLVPHPSSVYISMSIFVEGCGRTRPTPTR